MLSKLKPSYKRWLLKIIQTRYINRSIIFSFDLSVSVLSTFLSYVCTITFLSSWESWETHGSILTLLLLSLIISALLFWLFGIYRVSIRHLTIKGLPHIFYVLIAKELFLVLFIYYLKILSYELIIFCALSDMLFALFLMIGFRTAIANLYYSIINGGTSKQTNAFVYSTLDRSPMIAELINKSQKIDMHICGFLTTNKQKKGMQIYSQNVYWLDGNEESLLKLFNKNSVKVVVFTSHKNFNREKNRLVEFCIKHQIKMMISVGLQDLNSASDLRQNLKTIQIEDLLERDVIEVESEKIIAQLSNKVVMVTGAAGSIGSEIVNQLALFGVKEIICFDNAETPLHNLKLTIESNFPTLNVRYCLGDVRSQQRVSGVIDEYRPSIIFHAAAYKHVPMIESNPCEAVRVNVWGTLNLAQRAVEFGVDKFVMVSTDKAVNPTNVMGASKRIAELCVQYCNKQGVTQFITTRFGNVLGSNGSVIPLFKEQIVKGGPITITHPDIIRYFMTIPEACRLVLQAGAMGCGGEIFVFDMGEQVRIVDLAHKMISLSGLIPDEDIKIKYTGLRPGEKLYEELLSDKERTGATTHHKIRVSQIEVEISDSFGDIIDELISAAVCVDIERSIIIMKKIVPEFISNNSEFEKYDSITND